MLKHTPSGPYVLRPEEYEAGPELDALVAVKVMGWTYLGAGSWDKGRNNYTAEVPAYSTDIAAAGTVVQKVTTPGVVTVVKFMDHAATCQIIHDNWRTPMVAAETAPLAICRAALLIPASS